MLNWLTCTPSPAAELAVQAYTTYKKSVFVSLKPGEAITLSREKPPPPKPGKKQKDNVIVR